MKKVININRRIREYLGKQLEQFYEQTGNKEEALALYSDFVWELKEEKGGTFYQMVIGLCFSDACRLLHFFNLYNKLSDTLKKILKKLDYFENIEDIEDFLEKEPGYFSMLVQAPLKMQLFPLRDQAAMLWMSTRVTSYFDVFHGLEIQSVFRPRTLDEIRKIYERETAKKNKNALDVAYEQFIITSLGSVPQFQKLLLLLIKEFYKLSKAIEHNSIINLTDLSKNIIARVEGGSITDLLYKLAYDEDIMKEMLMIYLSLIPIYEASYEEIYEQQAPETVKQKLKEV